MVHRKGYICRIRTRSSSEKLPCLQPPKPLERAERIEIVELLEMILWLTSMSYKRVSRRGHHATFSSHLHPG